MPELPSIAPSAVVAVILAGGQGTRIRHLLPDLPKPMAPAAGKPFIEWVVRYLLAQGIGRVVISAGYKAEAIEAHFKTLSLPGLTLACVAEPEPLGTAGGFLHAVEASGLSPEGWLVLNGDSLALGPLAPLFAAAGKNGGALLGLRVEEASRYGTITVGVNDRITRFAEKRENAGPGTISAGVYLFHYELLASFPAGKPLSFETEVFPGLLAGGTSLGLAPLPSSTPFLDIGTPETLRQAETFIASNSSFFA
ncbi:nucleotidyltransferase family protein [Verrucomicrobium sp. GAS474]|uniref:nucleotidyltransferase family protein n=1 Tax=Verrucomicrobium sp. GAS474 TaxID=1882831 RepID=UPI000B837C3F|nr:nucleotidyltransferase family protein [Verrucomicrobium sp. GAS474]